MGKATTFDYVIRVPDEGRATRWRAEPRTPLAPDTPCLVGHRPIVELVDFDERPGVARTRISLTALDEQDAAERELSIVVNRNFAGMLRPGDFLHVANNYHGAIGVSVMRGGALVAAAGAVTAVPLGDDIVVRRPGDLWLQAQRIFRARDPRYEMWEVPIEITVGTETRLLHRGRPTLGGYEVFVVHGFVRNRECVGIERPGACADCAATLTAPLLERTDLVVIRPFIDLKALRAERDVRVMLALESARSHFLAGDLAAAESDTLDALLHDRNSEEAWLLYHQIEALKKFR